MWQLIILLIETLSSLTVALPYEQSIHEYSAYSKMQMEDKRLSEQYKHLLSLPSFYSTVYVISLLSILAVQ
jgi:hypothetical protein